MTPLQFAHEECANYQPDGSCLGAVIEDDLTMRRCRPLSRCALVDEKRCAYFEECVAPMADMVSDPRRAVRLQEAGRNYRAMTHQKSKTVRACPECGQPMAPRKRFCPVCSRKRRKNTVRQSTAQWRLGCEQLTGKSHEIPQ